MVRIGKILLTFVVLIGFAAEVSAQSQQPAPPPKAKQTQANNDGKNIANSNQTKAQNSLTNSNSVNNIPGYQNREWPKFNEAEAWLATGDSEAQSNLDSQFILNSHQNRPGTTISRDDPFLRRSLDLLNQDQDGILGDVTEQFADCTTEGGRQIINTTLGVQCERQRELVDETCQYGDAVVVDEDYVYDCDVVRTYGEEYCDYERQVTVDEDYEYSCVETATQNCAPDTTREECEPDTTRLVCEPDTTRRVCGPDTTERVCDPSTTTRVCDPDTTRTVCGPSTTERVCEPSTTTRVCTSNPPERVCSQGYYEHQCTTRQISTCPFNGAECRAGSLCNRRIPGCSGRGRVCIEYATCSNNATETVCTDVFVSGSCSTRDVPDTCTNVTTPGTCRNVTTPGTCTTETVRGTCRNVTTPGQCRNVTVAGECHDEVVPGACVEETEPGVCTNVTVPGVCNYIFDNTCDAFDEGALGCTDSGTICTQFDGDECIQRATTYLCEESISEAGSNVTLTDTLREVIADDTNEDAVCGALDSDGTCTHTATMCTASEETRTINGLAVYRDCWEWRKNYTCATEEYEDFCTGLEGPQACVAQGETCQSMGADGVCESFVRSYRCEDATAESEHVRLVSTPREIVSETTEGTCGDFSENPDCNKVGEICIEPAETRTINGLEVYRDCWRYEDSYQCVGPNFVDNCQDISDACTESGRTCLSRDSSGNCTAETIEYDCPQQSEIDTPEVLSCPSRIYCVDGDCDELVEDPSPDFPEGVTYLNILKGIQDELDPTNPDVFGAEPATCSRAVLGVVNCCNEGGSGLLNPIFGCSAEEQTLWRQVEDGKAVFVGSYCSARALFVCTKRRKSYCVFDSKLGRIIQEQGREQLGIDWSTAPEDASKSEKAENPDCRGLTVPELQAIDFSAIDFSEVIEDFMNNVQLPDASATADLVRERVNSFYDN